MFKLEVEKLYTRKETAKLLSVSEGTIRNEIKRGRLKELRLGTQGKAVRISGWEIQRFLQFLSDEPRKKCA